MSTIELSYPGTALTDLSRSGERRRVRPGAVLSLALHGAVIAVLIAQSRHSEAPPPPPPAIQLVLVPPEAPKPPAPTPPVALKPPPPTPAPPLHQAPPVARHTPPVEHRTSTPTTPERAEVAAQPVDATPAPAPAPAAPPAAPAATAPAPRVVGMEGIPSDYVNQVYARINASAAGHYPRAAKQRELEGRIRYRLTLAPDGKLLHVEIQGSGEAILDDAAREAIQAAGPFPKLPDLGGSTYQLSGAIVYKVADD